MLFQEYKLTHDELIVRGKKWLLGAGKCKFVLSEMMAQGNAEIPDLIGFNYQTSILIECKTSRSDFHADKKKPFRNGQRVGVGEKKYYLCDKGVIHKKDLPERWGLLWVCGKIIRVVEYPDYANRETERETRERLSHERDLLVSSLNRFQYQLGDRFEMIHKIDWNPVSMWEMKHALKYSGGDNYMGAI